MYIDAMGHRFGADLVCIAKSGCRQTFAQHQIDQTPCEGKHVDNGKNVECVLPPGDLVDLMLELEKLGVTRRQIERISKVSAGSISKIMLRRRKVGVKTIGVVHETMMELKKSYSV